MLSIKIVSLCLCLLVFQVEVKSESSFKCSDLEIGQYKCDEPEIDDNTQEIKGCSKDGNAFISCHPLNGINCSTDINGMGFLVTNFNGSQIGFKQNVTCRYTNGYYYSVAVGLSLFFGWLGVDRFYLGYPAIGILKFCTFGMCGIGALVDFLLVAIQVVVPSDGSNYIIDRYGPRLTQTLLDNDTYYKPQPD